MTAIPTAQTASLPTAAPTSPPAAATTPTSPTAAAGTSAGAGTTPQGTADASSGSQHYVRNEAFISLGKKAIDSVRAVVKVPEAARAGHLGSALLQTVLGTPTNRLIDPEAPAVATAASEGRSFTDFDRTLYRVSAGVDVGLGLFRVAYGVPNLIHAVKQNGAAGVYDTRQGRDGVLQTASGALTLGLFGRASILARRAGVVGAVPVVMAAATSESLTAPAVIVAYAGASALVLANDHGFLDFMNKGNTQSFGQVESTAWQQLDLRNKVANLGTQAQGQQHSSLVNRVGALAVQWASHSQ